MKGLYICSISFLLLLLLGACGSSHSKGLGHRQATLRHEKAIKLHHYLQNEVAMLIKVRKDVTRTVQIENLSYPEREEWREKNCQIENYQKLLHKQTSILENQNKYLKGNGIQHLTIQEREVQHNQIRGELKKIKQEVQQACTEINKLAANFKKIKNEFPKLAVVQ